MFGNKKEFRNNLTENNTTNTSEGKIHTKKKNQFTKKLNKKRNNKVGQKEMSGDEIVRYVYSICDLRS